jgi:biopolymer transport protein ExbD
LNARNKSSPWQILINVMLKHQSRAGLATCVATGLAAVALVCLTFTGSSQQPAPTGGDPAFPRSTNLVVKIDAKGNYTLGQTPVTFDQLRTNLMAESAKHPELRLKIQADKSAPLKAVMKVVDLMKEPGIGGVTLLASDGETAPVIAPGSNERPRINAPLTFYLVSKQRIEGGQFFNRFPFPKLGYVSSNSDLVLEHLKEVSSLPESSGPAWSVDRTTGTFRRATTVHVERFFFTLHDEDATRLRRLADKAERQGQLVLVLFGDKAINLLPAKEIQAKAQFEVIGNWGRAGVQEIADALKKLVQ